MSELRLHENEYTYLSVEKGRVYVKDIKTGEIASRAISLFPGVQIELGRDYHEIQDAFRQSRMPIFFKEVVKKNELTYLFLVRMGTGKIRTTELVTIICKNDIIYSMGFTGKTKEEAYRKYLPGPDFSEWELPQGETEEEKKVRELLAKEHLKKRFLGITNDDISITYEKKVMEICILHEMVRMKFVFIADRNCGGKYICNA